MDLQTSDYEDSKKIKIVLLGDRSVGKSSIIKRFSRNEFQEKNHPTVGIDYMFKNITYKGKKYKLELWDTAGQEKYRSLVRNYLKDADCALFIYDVTQKQTYTHLQQWCELFQESKQKENTLSMIVGNKIDCKRPSIEENKKIFNSPALSQYQRMEVSAKEGTNISELFTKLMMLLQENCILTKKIIPYAEVKSLKNIEIVKSLCCSK